MSWNRYEENFNRRWTQMDADKSKWLLPLELPLLLEDFRFSLSNRS